MMRWFAFGLVTAAALLAGAGSASAGSWGPAATISPSDQYVGTPAVSADQQGDMAIVWSNRLDSYDSSIEVVTRRAGGTWSAPRMVSDGQAGQNIEPSVSVGPGGTMVVAWSQNTHDGDLIRTSFGSIDEDSFSPPATLEGPEPYQQLHDPQVSIAADGSVFALWDPGDGTIHYVGRAAGASSFGAIHVLASPGGYPSFYPAFAIGPNGDAVAAWEDYHHLYAAVRPAGGTFGAVQTLQSSCVTGLPYDAINDKGAAVVDWTYTDSACDSGVAPTLVKAAYRPAGGNFGSAATAAEMGAWAGAGSAAVSPSGIATVATLGNLTSPASTAAATALSRRSDGSWGDPQPISYDTSINGSPVLAYDSAGNLYSAYDTRAYPGDSTADSGFFAAFAPAGGSFSGQDSQLSQTDGQVGMPPVLATAGSGSAIAVWTTGVVNSYFYAQASTYGPDTTGSSGSSGSSGPSGPSGSPASSGSSGSSGSPASSGSSGSSASPASPGSSGSAGSPSPGSVAVPSAPATTPGGAGKARRLIITGRARHARTVHVALVRGRRVYARGIAKPVHGRYRVVLTLVHVPRGRYTVQISLINRDRTVRQRRQVTIST